MSNDDSALVYALRVLVPCVPFGLAWCCVAVLYFAIKGGWPHGVALAAALLMTALLWLNALLSLRNDADTLGELFEGFVGFWMVRVVWIAPTDALYEVLYKDFPRYEALLWFLGVTAPFMMLLPLVGAMKRHPPNWPV